MDDVTEITQLVVRERQGRDQGRWDRMTGAWEPDGWVRISWIDGSASEFIAGSMAMSAGGTVATHRLSPPVVDVNGNRAIVELPAVIETRATIGGAEVDLASRVRLLFRVRRTDGTWLLHSMTCVYETDAITPVTPGVLPDLSAVDWEAHRPSYRWLAVVLGAGGHAIADDLPGEDWPDTVTELADAQDAWLRGKDGRVDATNEGGNS